jgi:hypothetical protein
MATYDAVTLIEVKTALSIDGTAEDVSLARLISATTLEVERLLGTQFVIREVVEQHEGGERRIYPQVLPIVAVSSVVDPAGNAVPAGQYVVRQKRWLEHWGHFPLAFNSAGQQTDYTVTYTAGHFSSTSTVAPDVKAEIVRAVGTLREAPAAGVTSVSVGDLSISYAGRYANQGSATLSPAIEAAANSLDRYRGVVL